MKRLYPAVIILAIMVLLAACDKGNAEEMNKYLVPGKVTMVDLGAGKCIPCKMMAPIIEEVRAEYEDKAAIVFLDVWEDQSAAEAFGIQLIPTQIFFDENGKEFMRHEGFMDKNSIVSVLAKLGVKPN